MKRINTDADIDNFIAKVREYAEFNKNGNLTPKQMLEGAKDLFNRGDA